MGGAAAELEAVRRSRGRPIVITGRRRAWSLGTGRALMVARRTAVQMAATETTSMLIPTMKAARL